MLKTRPESIVLADFSVVHEIRDEKGSVVARTGGGDRPWFEFAVHQGSWKRFSVDYTIGSKWQQAYATRAADDRLFVFPVQYSAVQKQWLNYWSMIDPPGTERTQIDRFPGLTPATNYQRNCGVCHTSQLRLMRLDDTTMQRASFREPGVNCEMCHGPSAEHIAAVRSGKSKPGNAQDPPFRFRQLNHIEGTLVCGQCHRQSAVRELGSGGEMNYSSSPPYFVRAAGRPPIELGPRAVYKDGRFRETTFIGEAFMRSACFRRGTAQCASCHDPHSADADDNKVSVRFRSQPDEMCLQCHEGIRERLSAHTKHPTSSVGSRCTACHMPPIMNSLLFKAASHQIEIPRGDTTLVFGPNDSPNACLLCHREQSPEWAAAKLQQWR